MKKTTKKKMSIEDLALSMSKGFKRVENKIDGSNKKIDNIVDLVDKLAASTLKGFEGVDKKFENLEVKLKTDFEGVNKRIDDFAKTKASKITYKDLEKRMGFVEGKLELKSK